MIKTRDVSIDHYLQRTFSMRDFNCWDLAREFWKEITGTDLGRQTPYETDTSALTERTHQVAATLRKLPQAQDPCLVLMCRSRIPPHVGVLYRGRVLHIREHGAEYRPLDQVTACYPHVSFYTSEPE